MPVSEALDTPKVVSFIYNKQIESRERELQFQLQNEEYDKGNGNGDSVCVTSSYNIWTN